MMESPDIEELDDLKKRLITKGNKLDENLKKSYEQLLDKNNEIKKKIKTFKNKRNDLQSENKELNEQIVDTKRKIEKSEEEKIEKTSMEIINNFIC